MTTDPKPTLPGLDRPPLPKRFYTQAAAELRDGLHVVVLDGRPARTPGRRPLGTPQAAVAEALAAEWQAQNEVIDPARMPLTRIVNSALDGVAMEHEAVAAEIVKYAGSDLICYRAGEPERLVAAQAAAWDPVLAWARDALGARFILAEGVMFQAQPEPAIAAIDAAVARFDEPVALAGLHVMTTLSGSALLALAVAHGRLDQAEAWRLAHVDEAHQEAFWGEDEEALARRARRGEDFAAAARLVLLTSA